MCCGSFGSSGKHQEAGSVAASTVPSWEPGHRSPGDHQRQPSRGHPTDEQARNADTMPEIVPNIGTQGHRRPATGFLLSRLPSYPPVTQRAREGPKIAPFRANGTDVARIRASYGMNRYEISTRIADPVNARKSDEMNAYKKGVEAARKRRKFRQIRHL